MAPSSGSPHERDGSFGASNMEEAYPGFVGGAEAEAAASATSASGRAHPDDTAARSDADIPDTPLTDRIRDGEGG